MVSFHYGAQHHSELKNLLRKSALLMAIGGVTLTVLARVLAAPLSRLFVGYDASLYALTTHAFRLFCWSFLLAGFNIFASGFFTALNNGAVSAAISFLRTLVFQAGWCSRRPPSSSCPCSSASTASGTPSPPPRSLPLSSPASFWCSSGISTTICERFPLAIA